CINPPRDDCNFYRTCLEAYFHCGPTGYPLAFGYKICTRFQERRALLSARGREWMVDTMECLQRALVPEAASGVPTCTELKDLAFRTHAGCYVSNGVCTLGVRDWLVIAEIIGIETFIGDVGIIRQVLETGEKCAEFYGWLEAGGLWSGRYEQIRELDLFHSVCDIY
ncbi:hypothetical protein AMATHDRAFT_143759, partial [Amanita thiersii Skay4041]